MTDRKHDTSAKSTSHARVDDLKGEQPAEQLADREAGQVMGGVGDLDKVVNAWLDRDWVVAPPPKAPLAAQDETAR